MPVPARRTAARLPGVRMLATSREVSGRGRASCASAAVVPERRRRDAIAAATRCAVRRPRARRGPTSRSTTNAPRSPNLPPSRRHPARDRARRGARTVDDARRDRRSRRSLPAADRRPPHRRDVTRRCAPRSTGPTRCSSEWNEQAGVRRASACSLRTFDTATASAVATATRISEWDVIDALGDYTEVVLTIVGTEWHLDEVPTPGDDAPVRAANDSTRRATQTPVVGFTHVTSQHQQRTRPPAPSLLARTSAPRI